MDSTSATPPPNPKSPSLHSTTSSLTLIPDQRLTSNAQTNAPSSELPYYTSTRPTGKAPKPFAQKKPQSALGKFMSKFQSPAVRQTTAARERELLEEERTGVKKVTTGSAASDPGAATAAHYAFSGGGPGGAF